MNVRKIELNSSRGLRTAVIEPMDNNGLMQYVVTLEENLEGPFEPGCFVVFEKDEGRYRQSPESVQSGPVLPESMMDQIGEALKQYYK